MAGFCYYKIEDYENALKLFDEYLKLANNSVEVDYYKGLCYYRIQDFKSAAKHLKIASKKDTKNPNILFYLGLSYHHLNKNREAKKILNKLYYIDSNLHDSLNISIRQ